MVTALILIALLGMACVAFTLGEVGHTVSLVESLSENEDALTVTYSSFWRGERFPVPGPIQANKGGSTPKPPKQEKIVIPKMPEIAIPPAPEPAPPPPPPPSQTQAEVQQAQDQTKRDARKRKGYGSTLLSGQGGTASTATGGNTLLG